MSVMSKAGHRHGPTVLNKFQRSSYFKLCPDLTDRSKPGLHIEEALYVKALTTGLDFIQLGTPHLVTLVHTSQGK